MAVNHKDGPLAFCPGEFGEWSAGEALFHVIPAPLEKSVSYGGGTSRGPDAILVASDELEAIYLDQIPGEKGIFVKQAIDASLNTDSFLKELSSSVSDSLKSGKIPLTLGGEHTITYGAYAGVKDAFVDEPVGIIQIDAHADLRPEYLGDPWSHACVIRRIHEQWQTPVLQLGIRGISKVEKAYRLDHTDTIAWIDAPELWRNGIPDSLLPEGFPQKVYITFDVDGLDASLMPATGTPSPGGLFWHQVEEIYAVVAASGRTVVGCDVVELAPIADFHAPDFTAAVATYALMALCEKCADTAGL